MSFGKVSIIMAAYNASEFIHDAIESVLFQDYEHFELLVINDGSTDNTVDIVQSFKDSRINLFSQENRGVGQARNYGLRVMKGDFICFLDADDLMPQKSLSSRMLLFEQNDLLDFVDGTVEYIDDAGVQIGTPYRPRFEGNPLPLLLRLDRRCFLGITWLIRKRAGVSYVFDTSMSHSEDIMFYIDICASSGGTYSFTSEKILCYRQAEGSAMSNLKGLEDGYLQLLYKLHSKALLSWSQSLYLKYRVSRIMFLSHLRLNHDLKSALRVLKRTWFK